MVFNGFTCAILFRFWLSFIIDDLLVNVAAGNSGRYNELNTVGTPAVAKNILSVGSSQSADDGETSGVTPRQGGQEYVSDFSSRGTTADGRIKPDVVWVFFDVATTYLGS